MKFETVLFDFDGTLFDSGPGITSCMRETLEKNGYHVDPGDTLSRFVGPPLPQALRDFYGITGEDAVRFIEEYRVIYAEKGIHGLKTIEGAEHFVRRLRALGVKTAIASSKPLRFVRIILGESAISDCFDVIGAAGDDEKTEKSAIVAQAMRDLHADPAKTVMIGDRKFDVIGAHANGIPCIGLDSGFGEEGELQKAGALYVVRTYAELEKIFFDE